MNIVKNNEQSSTSKIKLEDIAELINGYSFKNEDMLDSGEFPIVKISNMIDGEIAILDSNKFSNFNVSRAKILKNDLVIGLSGYVGKNAVFSLDKDCLLNQRCVIVRSKNPIYQEIINFYVPQLIKKVVKQKVNNGAIPNLSSKEVGKIEVDVDFDLALKNSLILKERKENLKTIQTLISKMEQRNQYYFDKIFFGEMRFDDNGNIYQNTQWKDVNINGYSKKIPNSWSIEKLENIVKLEKGVNIPVSDLNYDDGIQYLRSGDVWEKSSSSKDNLYYSGDNLKKISYKSKNDWIICFDGYNTTPFNGTIGLVTNQGEGTLSGRLYKIKGFEGKSLEFTNIALLQSLYMKNIFFRFSEGSMSKSVTKHAKRFDFPLIPIEEQNHIAEFTRKLLKEVDLFKELYSKEKQVFQWLCEKLVSGEYKIEED